MKLSDADALVTAPLFAPAEDVLMKDVGPPQRAMLLLQAGLEREELISSVLDASLSARRSGAPLTAVQQRLISGLSAQRRATVLLRIAVRDGAATGADGKPLDGLLEAPLFEPRTKELIDRLEPAQKALQELQAEQQRVAERSALLAESLAGRKPRAALTELQKKLLARLPEQAQKLFTVRQAIQDGMASRFGRAELDRVFALPELSEAEQGLLAKVAPEHQIGFKMQRERQHQQLLEAIFDSTVQSGAGVGTMQSAILAKITEPAARNRLQEQMRLQERQQPPSASPSSSNGNWF